VDAHASSASVCCVPVVQSAVSIDALLKQDLITITSYFVEELTSTDYCYWTKTQSHRTSVCIRC